MSKEMLKNTLLGMRLSKKESEAIKGGIAAGTSASTSASSTNPIGTVVAGAWVCILKDCSPACNTKCTTCTGWRFD